jgi:hypothetical protein
MAELRCCLVALFEHQSTSLRVAWIATSTQVGSDCAPSYIRTLIMVIGFDNTAAGLHRAQEWRAYRKRSFLDHTPDAKA